MADLICERSRKNYISVREDRESEAHPKEVVLDRGGKKEKGKSCKEGERQLNKWQKSRARQKTWAMQNCL